MATMSFLFNFHHICSVLVVFRRSEKRNLEIQDGVGVGSEKPSFSATEIQRKIKIISRRAIKLFYIITLLLYELKSLSFKPAPYHSLSESKKTKTPSPSESCYVRYFFDEKLTG